MHITWLIQWAALTCVITLLTYPYLLKPIVIEMEDNKMYVKNYTETVFHHLMQSHSPVFSCSMAPILWTNVSHWNQKEQTVSTKRFVKKGILYKQIQFSHKMIDFGIPILATHSIQVRGTRLNQFIDCEYSLNILMFIKLLFSYQQFQLVNHPQGTILLDRYRIWAWKFMQPQVEQYVHYRKFHVLHRIKSLIESGVLTHANSQ